MAASELTRVRVLRFENMRAMVRLARAERRGHDVGSWEDLWAHELSISVRSSSGVRLEMERKCRGGLADVESERIELKERGMRWVEGFMVLITNGCVASNAVSCSVVFNA